LAVVYPLRYLALVTERRCYYVIVWNWTASLILTAPIYFLIEVSWSEDLCFVRGGKVSSGNTLAYLLVSQVIGGFLPMALMVYANVRMFIVVVRVMHQVAADIVPSGAGTNASVLQQHTLSMSLFRSVRSSRNIIIICSVFVCIISLEEIVVLTVSLHQTQQQPSGVEIAAMWLFFNNSSINSLLYIVLHRCVRTALMHLFHC